MPQPHPPLVVGNNTHPVRLEVYERAIVAAVSERGRTRQGTVLASIWGENILVECLKQRQQSLTQRRVARVGRDVIVLGRVFL